MAADIAISPLLKGKMQYRALKENGTVGSGFLERDQMIVFTHME
jgi:hypothetical protein